MDTYQSFNELKRNETAYHFELCDRNSPFTILAPHGGRIEPHTSEIARLIAGSDVNYYSFNGTREGCNRDLHITSHRFDEKQALALTKKSELVIAVHGCSRIEELIFLGGLDNDLKLWIAEKLEEEDMQPVISVKRFSGIHVDNICNRGRTGKGVQLEISRPLRDDPAAREAIARAVRAAIGLQNPAQPA
jgi:phage replication-related protein YjqB (UPF0714/DUF867 family)